MAVLVRCASCRAEFRAQDKYRGKETSCPKCHQSLIVDGSSIPDYDVFISYSSADKPAADAVCAALEAKRWRCWIAPRDVLAGSEWGGAIVEAIERSRLMVLVYSSHANQSQQVIREVERAVNKNLPLIPFRIDGAVPSKNMEYFLSASHWLDAMTAPMEEHLERLGAAVKALLTARAELQKSGAVDRNDPASVAAPAQRLRRSPLMPWAVVLATFLLAGGIAFAIRRSFRTASAPPAALMPAIEHAPATTQAAGILERTVLLRKQPFLLRKGNREQYTSVTVPAIASGSGILQITVFDMGDDSGDGGMRMELLDGRGQVVLNKFGTRTEFFTYEVTSHSSWTVVLRDLDTARDGNGGAMEIAVVPK